MSVKINEKLLSDEQLAQLRAANPRGVTVLNQRDAEDAVVAQFAFKRIDRSGFAAYRAANKLALASGGGDGEEEQQVAFGLLLWPDKEALKALREDAPGLVTDMGQTLINEARNNQYVDRDPR